MSSFAQNESINYKALIKDGDGNLMINQPISLKFIISAGFGEDVLYEEEHIAVNTDSNGIIILNIGEGSVITGSFSDIDWNAFGLYTSLRTAIDLAAGTSYSFLGQSVPFKTVPYAKLADRIRNQAFFSFNGIIQSINTNDDFVIGGTQLDYDGTGDGKRMFFDRFKAAFRAGSASDEWDEANRGPFSFASGLNTKASGSSSTAMGNRTQALGPESTALGFETVATGLTSIAMGNQTIASGSSATAMGTNTIASTTASTAIGSYNIDDTNAQFMVGIGNSIARKNAFTVKKNGNIELNGQIKFGQAAFIDVGAVNNFDVRINGSIRSTIDNADNLGSPTYRYNTVYATNGTIQTSDKRDKTNITALPYGLKDIMQLKPVSFNWKTKPNQDKKLGLIAQDLIQVIPEVVLTQEDISTYDTDRTKTKKANLNRYGVFYSDLIPVLVKAIQEQQTIIDSLTSKIEQQNEKIEAQALENTKQNRSITSLLQRTTALEVANNQ